MRTLARYSLSLMLAGCVAQASDKEARQMAAMDQKMVGRSVEIPLGQVRTVLDWRGEDIGAEEMVVTVGAVRPGFSDDPLASLYAEYPPDPPALGASIRPPNALIAYGIEGFSEKIVIDAWPEQSIVVPASFVRVDVLNNFTALPSAFFKATVSRAVGKSRIAARYSRHDAIAAGGNLRYRVPGYVKEVMITRIDTVVGQGGPLDIRWENNSLGSTTEQTLYAATVPIPLLRPPGNPVALYVGNTGANIQTVEVVWFVEP